VASRGRIRAREDQTVVGDPGMARPDLVPVDHEVVAVPARGGLEREQIGAGVGLAEALPEGDLAPRDARQQLAAQGLGAVADDGVGNLIAAGERAEGRAARGQLLEEDELVDHRALLAAVRARPAHGQPPARAERPHEGARVRAGAIARVHAVVGETLGRMRAEECAQLLGECPLLGAPAEVHRGVSRAA
jgi:hypothetical protein